MIEKDKVERITFSINNIEDLTLFLRLLLGVIENGRRSSC